MFHIHGPASSTRPPTVTITASTTLVAASNEVVTASRMPMPPRIRTAPMATRTGDTRPDSTASTGVPKLAKSRRARRSPGSRAQRTAKPIAASTAGHAMPAPNQRPTAQSRAMTPPTTSTDPRTARGGGRGRRRAGCIGSLGASSGARIQTST